MAHESKRDRYIRLMTASLESDEMKIEHELCLTEEAAKEVVELLKTQPGTLQNLPKPNNGFEGWIPCTERLPEEKEKSYWVCFETGGQCQCRWTNDMYGLGANKWSKWGWHIMDKPQYSKIVAWMPLPAPYKPKEGTE